MYLVAHKAYGEATFDVATKLTCPVCEPMRQGIDDGSAPYGCDACEGEGHWWILNCGHRCYPYWAIGLKTILWANIDVPEMPDHAIDTYTKATKAPEPPKADIRNILSKIGLGRTINRRI